MGLISRVSKGEVGGLTLPNLGIDQREFNKPKATREYGTSGLLRTSGVGYVFEEWLRDLSTYRQRQIYREMRDNDAVIGSMFFALETLLRQAETRIDPAPIGGSEAENVAQFARECCDDMSHSWTDFIAEAVNMFAFGFSLFETVYKRRDGVKGKHRSKFDDGMIGWRKFAPRAQESIQYWMWDEEGGLQGAVQIAAPIYATVPLPISKLLLFRTTSMKNSPEGRSLLRNCYRPWFFKRRIEEVEAIGMERDLCGIPVLYASAEAQDSMGGEAYLQRLVTSIRLDEQAGIVLPMTYDAATGQPLIKLELLRAAGSKQTDPGKAIQRYNAEMYNTILAGFIQFGQLPTGSRALHQSAAQIFTLALKSFMNSICGVFNRIALPRLMELNGIDARLSPILVPTEIGVRDLAEIADFISKLAATGMTFFDVETENFLRKIANIPQAEIDAKGERVPQKNPLVEDEEEEPEEDDEEAPDSEEEDDEEETEEKKPESKPRKKIKKVFR